VSTSSRASSRVEGGALVGGADLPEDAERFLEWCAPVVAAADVEEGRVDARQAGWVVDAVTRPEPRPGKADSSVDVERRGVLHDRRAAHRGADQEDAFGTGLSSVGGGGGEVLAEREPIGGR
jgi:hypothetical protein